MNQKKSVTKILGMMKTEMVLPGNRCYLGLTESNRPRKDGSDLKKKLLNEGFDQLYEKIGQQKLNKTERQ
ncbi:MAG: hypothetical protein Q8M94_11520 [Ignavibacteria bacterium]|nr:hypothetical protein [Ignavibacteria bacterium]